MTVEERAQLMIEDFIVWTNTPSEGKEELKARFVNHLRDQIEDCAKKADGHEAEAMKQLNESRRNGKGLSEIGHVFEASAAKFIADNIRALAAPKEEEKANEYKHSPWRCGCEEKRD